MTAGGDRPDTTPPRRDYRTLPPGVRAEDTVATVDADPVPDPHAGRNVDQHLALRED